jgi:2-oxoglutarate ferredoxin oxidoreductase subunit delta
MARVRILEEYCKGCELCVPVCPKKLLALSNRVNKHGVRVVCIVRSDGCTGCCNCAVMCPDAAIEVLSEERQRAKDS